MLKFIKKLFQKKPKIWKKPHDNTIIHAFTDEFGADYFQFADSFQIPPMRALQAHAYYNELEMRCTREYLQGVCDAVINCLSPSVENKKIDWNKAIALIAQTKERLDYIFEPSIVLKLASVVYFDKNEDPYSFDLHYSEKKIKRWESQKSLNAFFLTEPIKSLLPPLVLSDTDLEGYLKGIRLRNQVMLEEIIDNISKEGLTTEYGRYLVRELERNKALMN